ncbi:sugar-binding transcriptional regulator [Inquilinus sp. CAU 1745]|uniref:sugar-binding transcriptional regulator n=1 Tax=Inquilinus sp. CAU 1745 TaxID=3140369 RepID=UPI00325B6C58
MTDPIKSEIAPAGTRRLDQAARAAWLYYIAGNTQDEIATKLGLSRPGAQRLIALAQTEKLIRFRIDHPIVACMELAERLTERFKLDYCEVVPSDPAKPGHVAGLAAAASVVIDRYLSERAPQILTFGTGRTLRATIREVSPTDQPQHKVVSVVGNLTRDGRATPYDVVIRLADRVGAQCFPLPMPLIAESREQRTFLHAQHWAEVVMEMASAAKVSFFGVGPIGWNAPLHIDGFIKDAELAELIELGAVGEIAGWAYDTDGRIVEGGTNDRVTALPPHQPPGNLTIGIAAGENRAPAIRAALKGRLLTGLITDEAAAAAILSAVP